MSDGRLSALVSKITLIGSGLSISSDGGCGIAKKFTFNTLEQASFDSWSG